MQLNKEERTVLLDVLEMHLEGMTEARERMIEDTATLGDFETFSETLQQHDIDVQTVESIKRKVLEDGNSTAN